MMTVRLSTKETFVIPDKYTFKMMVVPITTNSDTDIIKVKCLVVSDNNTEPVKKRYYPLSHIISFGDDIGVLP